VSITVPQPIGEAAQWQTTDYGDASAKSAAAAANGRCTVQLAVVPENELWLVDRIVVTCTSTSTTQCVIYEDLEDPQRALEYTRSGNLDVADESSPIHLDAGTSLYAVWTGASVGATATLRAQWAVLRKTQVY